MAVAISMKQPETVVDAVKNRLASGEKPFDLIFMYMHMRVMDGIEAATEIAALNTGTPIVAMTANIMSGDLEIYKQHGMEDCVGKPFTSQELWRCLMSISVRRGHDRVFNKNEIKSLNISVL
jgi:CheY-like chemotaxis protein